MLVVWVYWVKEVGGARMLACLLGKLSGGIRVVLGSHLVPWSMTLAPWLFEIRSVHFWEGFLEWEWELVRLVGLYLGFAAKGRSPGPTPVPRRPPRSPRCAGGRSAEAA